MRGDDISDQLELRKLVDSYAVFADAPDPDAFADLFLPDGSIIGSPYRRIAIGAEELRTKVVLFRVPRPFAHTFHLVANHLCEIHGDDATGVTYCIAHHVASNGDVQVTHIRYDDEYSRTAAGWRFATRTLTRVWNELRSSSSATSQDLADRVASL